MDAVAHRDTDGDAHCDPDALREPETQPDAVGDMVSNALTTVAL